MASNHGMILVMGETGVGKSTFINALKPNSVEVGHTLKSVQSRPQAVQIHLDEEGQNSITVVDTPGFDDSHRPESEVFTEITEFLAAQYAAKIPLKGVIFLHRIQDNRMRGSARTHLDTFRSLCGEEALANVMLVTTFWNKVPSYERGEYLRREQELIDDYWSPMQKKGSIVAKFDGSKEAAESLILQLAFSEREVVLDIQRELVDDQKVISETTAGLGINEQLDVDIKRWRERASKIENELAVAEDERNSEKVKQLKDEKRELHRVIENLDKSKKRMQSRVGNELKFRLDKEQRQKLVVSGISVFATVLSITLTIVKFVAFGG
ncbi:hypothetical protein G7054_g11868 [Neopestalotiopsis clavispora]|nr:hypothetical protein G7054_g11868 [Neopestalotiopsis clavispora]